MTPVTRLSLGNLPSSCSAGMTEPTGSACPGPALQEPPLARSWTGNSSHSPARHTRNHKHHDNVTLAADTQCWDEPWRLLYFHSHAGGVSAPAKHRYPSLSLSSHHGPLSEQKGALSELLRGCQTSLGPAAERGLQSVGKQSSKSSEVRSCSRREGAQQGQGTSHHHHPPL